MPVNVILKKQRREVGGVMHKPGDACVLPDELADALAMYGLCVIAVPLTPDNLTLRTDEAATAKAIARAKKVKADLGKPPKAPKKKPPVE